MVRGFTNSVHGRSITLALVLGLAAPAVRVQAQGSPATDPFAQVNADLGRALDVELRRAGEMSHWTPTERTLLRQSMATEKLIRPPGNIFSGILPDQVVAARRRFLALGVDAARIFTEEGVPQELLRIAAIESNYDPMALSARGARGVWQLMPETAARFGLRVDSQTDERTQPVRSTRAAAQYLRKLYGQFGDWRLALAAYNAGEGAVSAAIQRAGTNDFGQLAERRLLPDETRRYVPAVLAYRPSQ